MPNSVASPATRREASVPDHLIGTSDQRNGFKSLCRIDADAIHLGVLGFDIALEPAVGPTVQLHHWRELLPTQRDAAQDKMFETKVFYSVKEIAQKRAGCRMLPATFDKVEYVRVNHVRDPHPHTIDYSIF